MKTKKIKVTKQPSHQDIQCDVCKKTLERRNMQHHYSKYHPGKLHLHGEAGIEKGQRTLTAMFSSANVSQSENISAVSSQSIFTSPDGTTPSASASTSTITLELNDGEKILSAINLLIIKLIL